MSSAMNETEKNKVHPGTLYLVSTPIGNLSDLSDRARKVLSEVDFIAAEDTRNSLRLLTHFDIHKPMVSYFEHNKREHGEMIAERLEAGESCALVTDAGTPAISDPGEDLVALCAERGIPVTAIPGPVASITALILSGLDTGRFCFEGFLPVDRKERIERLTALQDETRTMLLHEAPHKLRKTLVDLQNALGSERKIALCRELTKINEEIMRTTLGGANDYYREDNVPRGEYVLVIEGLQVSEPKEIPFWHDMSLQEHVGFYQAQGLWKIDAIKQVAKDRSIPKKEVYNAVVKVKRKGL